MEESIMSTTLAKLETVERKWYVIDAAGKPLGRTAVIAANLLRGKHKTTFTPNVDCGDYVIIINTDKAILTGKKLDQKSYYRVSGWIGGLKETKARVMMDTRSDYAMELAVKGMLPKNTLGRNCLGRLHLCKGAEHNHAAQKPEAWTLD
jgi:large subunit ribosomal protein L13